MTKIKKSPWILGAIIANSKVRFGSQVPENDGIGSEGISLRPVGSHQTNPFPVPVQPASSLTELLSVDCNTIYASEVTARIAEIKANEEG